MKRIMLSLSLILTAASMLSCEMFSKEKELLLIPLLDSQIQFVPVSPDSFSDGQVYFMEDWAEWDTPDDRPVFYLGKGQVLTKVQLPYGYRIVPGVFSQDCTKYYAGISDTSGANFRFSVIDFVAGTMTRIGTTDFDHNIVPSSTGSFGSYKIGTQHYKLNVATGEVTPFVSGIGTSILWSSFSEGYTGESTSLYSVDSSSGAKTLVKTLPFSLNNYYAKDLTGKEFAMVAGSGTNDLKMSVGGSSWETSIDRVGYVFYDSEQRVYVTRSDAVSGASETWFIKNDGTPAKYFPEKTTSHQIQNFCRKSVI